LSIRVLPRSSLWVEVGVADSGRLN
jgi:hypothetical protein